MSMSALSIKALQTAKNMVFPHTCPLCAKLMDEKEGCCAECLQSIAAISQYTCLSCGIPLNPTLAPGPCGACLKKPLPQQQTHHLYLYQGVVRDAILAWKLQGQDVALNFLLQAATPHLKQLISKDDLLLPVPMPLYRMRRSGLHHSADLCQKISNIVGCQIDTTILRRTGNHTRQSALQGKARSVNLRKAFMLRDTSSDKLSSFKDKGKIWVIDDILTTGATLRHACQVMQKTKHPIFAFSFARTWHDS